MNPVTTEDVAFWRNACAANGALLKEAKRALIKAAYWMPPASPMQDEVLAMIEKIKRYEDE